MNTTKTIEFSEHRCWECGRHYAVEKFISGSPSCPYCGKNRVGELEQENATLQRSNRAYKAIFARKHK